MNKTNIINILKNNIIFIALFILALIGVVYFLGISTSPEAPILKVVENFNSNKKLVEDIENQKQTLEKIIQDKKLKQEASKKATTKEFYRITKSGNDLIDDFSPMFDNVITMIRQNGLRMKSIKYINSPSDDILLRNGGGAYKGYKVDFKLVGYYTQLTQFLSEIKTYPYFINLAKFEIIPYQYDKKILIADVSIVFYSKR